MAKQPLNAIPAEARGGAVGLPYWKPVFLLMTSILVIASYYAKGAHTETAGAWFAGYVLTMAVFYGCWKAWTALSGKKEVSYSASAAIGVGLLQVALLCGFFPFPAGIDAPSLKMLFKILGLLALPVAIVTGTSAFGFAALKKFLPDFDSRSSQFRTVSAMSLGLSTFLFSLSATTSAFGYNLATTLVPLVVLSALGWKEYVGMFKSLRKPVFTADNHDADGGLVKLVALRLVTTEVLFMILTFLVSVSLVNAVRPMPIGWDDLGVYMNYPKIMAQTGYVGQLGIVAWQSFTGIGFLFQSAPQAFYLNQVGGILSVVFIMLALSRLFAFADSKKSYLSLPLLFATALYAMPMIVFQQAKDMKLDPGLLCITTAAIFVLYEAVHRRDEHGKDAWKTFALAGFLAGIAFAVKFTTLMLFLGGTALICYAGLGLSGFYGFFAIFVGAFTKLKLWDMINVNYPKDDPALLTKVVVVSFAVAVLAFAYGIHKNRESAMKRVFVPLFAFAIAAAVALAPWIAKNAYEAAHFKAPLNVGTLLNGVAFPVPADVKSVRSASEIAAIDKKIAEESMNESWKTTNEDLGRYFGYDEGVNNYLKLPLNLTYQKNQPGEYTEITYVFLALLPAVFAFLAFRQPALAWMPVAMVIFEYLYFWNPVSSTVIGGFFWKIFLPAGYFVIAAFALLPLAVFHYALDRKDPRNERFLGNLAFLGFYGFVFVIAAYGIVWYGIAVYLSMFVAMGYSLERAVSEEDDLEAGTGFPTAVLVFGIVATYFFNSAVPHGWANFRGAGFAEFKSNQLNQEEAIFASHPDYLAILASLNLKTPKETAGKIVAAISDAPTKAIVIENVGEKPDVERLREVLDQMVATDPASVSWVPAEKIVAMKEAATEARNQLYGAVLYPAKEDRNQATIYRIGTFLTYFISENRKRYLEDSLVQSFGQYVYDENPDVTVERLKKLGMKYFLIDLNAATIDKDPRHDLTKRFESLLRTFKSDKLRLIKTDSLCLEAAVATKEKQQDGEYMLLAGVNYESYSGSTVTYRTQKQAVCQKYFFDLIKGGYVSKEENSYLLPLANYIAAKKPQTDEAMMDIIKGAATHGWVALFEIK